MNLTRTTPETGTLDFDISPQPFGQEDRLEGLSVTLEEGGEPVLIGYVRWSAISGYYWSWGSQRRFWELAGMCEQLTEEGYKLIWAYAPDEARAWEANQRWGAMQAPTQEPEVYHHFEEETPAVSIPLEIWIVGAVITLLLVYYLS